MFGLPKRCIHISNIFDVLKPCSHCGSTDLAISDDDPNRVSIFCKECGCGTGEERSVEDALCAWNRRCLRLDSVEKKEKFLKLKAMLEELFG